MAIAVNPTDTNITPTENEASQARSPSTFTRKLCDSKLLVNLKEESSSGVARNLQQPVRKEGFPIIIVVLTVAVFAISYLWMDS